VDTTVEWGQIQGQTITFPMEVKAFNAITMGFSVPTAAAARLLPGDAFELVEIGDGIAQLIVNICDYRDNPWGDYNEVNLGFLARPVGAPEDVIGSFVYRMPVNQDFTCQAGNEVMGFPKTVERIDVAYREQELAVELWTSLAAESGEPRGELSLAVTVPRVTSDDEPARIEAVSYSYLNGAPYGTPLEMDLASGVVDPAAVELSLGTGVVADELRSLGLPKAPDFCTYGEDLAATFQLGSPA